MSRRKERHSYDPAKSPPRSSAPAQALAAAPDRQSLPVQRPGLASTLPHTILDPLVVRDDGWLRMVPDTLDDKLYFKWKFTRGRWTGYYAMSVVTLSEAKLGIELLLRKLDKIDRGEMRPALDTFHDTR